MHLLQWNDMMSVKSSNTPFSPKKIFINVSCPSDSFQFWYQIESALHLRLSDIYDDLGSEFKTHQGNGGDNTSLITVWGKQYKSLWILKWATEHLDTFHFVLREMWRTRCRLKTPQLQHCFCQGSRCLWLFYITHVCIWRSYIWILMYKFIKEK